MVRFALLLGLVGCTPLYVGDYHDPRWDIPKLTDEQVLEYIQERSYGEPPLPD